MPARRNRALALPGVLAAASAVLGACYSARIWHGGVFRLSKTTVFQRWVLALSLCERAELIGQSSSSFQTALLSMRAAQALLPARYSRPAPRQRKHGVTDGWKGPPTSRALPEHKNAGRRGRTFGARDDETPSLVTNFTRIRRRWNATGAGVAPGRDFAGTGRRVDSVGLGRSMSIFASSFLRAFLRSRRGRTPSVSLCSTRDLNAAAARRFARQRSARRFEPVLSRKIRLRGIGRRANARPGYGGRPPICSGREMTHSFGCPAAHKSGAWRSN